MYEAILLKIIVSICDSVFVDGGLQIAETNISFCLCYQLIRF